MLIGKSLFTFFTSLAYAFHSLIKLLTLILWILKEHHLWEFEPDIPNSLRVLNYLWKTRNFTKNVGAHYCFCHPAIWPISKVTISFFIVCKELTIAQLAPIINHLCQRLNLISAYRDAFYGLTHMLTSKNANNDVSKDSGNDKTSGIGMIKHEVWNSSQKLWAGVLPPLLPTPDLNQNRRQNNSLIIKLCIIVIS